MSLNVGFSKFNIQSSFEHLRRAISLDSVGMVRPLGLLFHMLARLINLLRDSNKVSMTRACWRVRGRQVPL